MREMGRNARADFDRKYSADANYAILMDIYEAAIKKGPAPAERKVA
jgi:hypothetical protein